MRRFTALANATKSSHSPFPAVAKPPLPEEEKPLNPYEQGQNPSVWDHIKTHSSSMIPPASGRVSGGVYGEFLTVWEFCVCMYTHIYL